MQVLATPALNCAYSNVHISRLSDEVKLVKHRYFPLIHLCIPTVYPCGYARKKTSPHTPSHRMLFLV